MKFKLFFILILLPCLVFCGCKKDQLEATVPQPTVVTEPPTEPPAPKAGLLLRNMTADEQDGLALQGALESIGYEVGTEKTISPNKTSRQPTLLLPAVRYWCCSR